MTTTQLITIVTALQLYQESGRLTEADYQALLAALRGAK